MDFTCFMAFLGLLGAFGVSGGVGLMLIDMGVSAKKRWKKVALMSASFICFYECTLCALLAYAAFAISMGYTG